jgi:hypothetical protein
MKIAYFWPEFKPSLSPGGGPAGTGPWARTAVVIGPTIPIEFPAAKFEKLWPNRRYFSMARDSGFLVDGNFSRG